MSTSSSRAKAVRVPIQLPTKFELTARAPGLTIPPTILVLTDKVIEGTRHFHLLLLALTDVGVWRNVRYAPEVSVDATVLLRVSGVGNLEQVRKVYGTFLTVEPLCSGTRIMSCVACISY